MLKETNAFKILRKKIISNKKNYSLIKLWIDNTVSFHMWNLTNKTNQSWAGSRHRGGNHQGGKARTQSPLHPWCTGQAIQFGPGMKVLEDIPARRRVCQNGTSEAIKEVLIGQYLTLVPISSWVALHRKIKTTEADGGGGTAIIQYRCLYWSTNALKWEIYLKTACGYKISASLWQPGLMNALLMTSIII